MQSVANPTKTTDTAGPQFIPQLAVSSPDRSPDSDILGLQRTLGNRAVSRLLRAPGPRTQSPNSSGDAHEEPVPASTNGLPSSPATPSETDEVDLPAAAKPPEGGGGGQGLVVDDNAATVSANQMRKSDFLDALHDSVNSMASLALGGLGAAAGGGDWIDSWFGYYAGQEASQLERAIIQFAPEAAKAPTARDYIPAVTDRISRTAATGAMPDLPAGAMQSMQAAGPAPVLFKALPGGPREPVDPGAIRSSLGRGESIPGAVRSRMESAFNVSFSHVRMHTDPGAARLASDMNARAFTVGEHVAFGAGQYQPGTLIGDALMAHELAHIVQQNGAGASGQQMSEPSLETDADRAAIGVVSSLWLGENVLPGADSAPRVRSGLALSRCKFPSYDDIVADAVVSAAANTAWANVLAATTPATRREEGFWIQWNSTNDAYAVGPTIVGTVVGPAATGSVTLGPRPPDPGGNVYMVGSFHAHTPTTFRAVGRGVGPSDADNRNNEQRGTPGIIYDYVESPPGSGSIPAGHPLNSPARLYHSGPMRRC